MAYLEQIITNIAIAVHGKKGTPLLETIDFMPDWAGQGLHEKKQTTEQMKQILLDFAKQHNKRLGNQTLERLKKRKEKQNEHRDTDSDTRSRHIGSGGRNSKNGPVGKKRPEKPG